MKWIDFIRANAMFLGAITLVAFLILTVAAKAQEVPYTCITLEEDRQALSVEVEGGDYPTVAHLVGRRLEAFFAVVGRPDVVGVITDVVIWPNVFRPYLKFITVYVEGCRAKHANLPSEAVMFALEQIGVTPHTYVPPVQKGPAI